MMSVDDNRSSLASMYIFMIGAVFIIQGIYLVIRPPILTLNDLTPVIVRYGTLAGIGAMVFGLLSPENLRLTLRKVFAGLLLGTFMGYWMDQYLDINQGKKDMISFAIGLCVEVFVLYFRSELKSRLREIAVSIINILKPAEK